jgi:ABC-type dipeptide/oligopeptide/nickel transport system permease component
MVIAAFVMIINLVVDLVAALIDPRLRYGTPR